jgi:hypothetical protein
MIILSVIRTRVSELRAPRNVAVLCYICCAFSTRPTAGLAHRFDVPPGFEDPDLVIPGQIAGYVPVRLSAAHIILQRSAIGRDNDSRFAADQPVAVLVCWPSPMAL